MDDTRRIPNLLPGLQEAQVIVAAANDLLPAGVVLSNGAEATVSIVGQVATIVPGPDLLRQANVWDTQTFSAAGTWTKPSGKTITYLYGSNGGTLTLAATWTTASLGATVSVTTPVPGTNYRFNGITVITPLLYVASI